MSSRTAVVAVLAVALLSACASEPAPVAERFAPLAVYPSAGQSVERQDRDRFACHEWAVRTSGFDPGSAPLQPIPARAASDGTATAAGAVTGAVVGAAASRPHHAGEGAVVGAVVGAATGAVIDAQAAESRAQRGSERIAARYDDYRRALTACLEGRGYTVR